MSFANAPRTTAARGATAPRATRGVWAACAAAAIVLGSRTGTMAQQAPSAAQPAAETTDPDSGLAQSLRSIAGEPLRLEDAVQAAIANATEVRQADAEVQAAAAALQHERGSFDTSLFANGEWGAEERPRSSIFAETERGTRTLEVGAKSLLPTGAEVTASVRTIRSTTDAPFASFSPQYDAHGGVDLVQPLLAGVGPAAHREVAVAERNLTAARALADATRRDVEARTEAAYWDLYAAERDVAVEDLLRTQGGRFLDEVRKRASSGLVGPDQIANARVFLAEHEDALLDRQERMDELSDALAAVMNRRPPGSAPRYRPVTEPPRDFAPTPADSAVAQALRENPTLQAFAAQTAAAKAAARGTRWSALPVLDFVGSWGANSLTGTGRTLPDFSNPDSSTTVPSLGGLSDALSDVFNHDFPTWSAGFRFSLPLGLRSERGDLGRDRAQVIVAEQQYERARRGLEVSVRGGCRELDHAQARVRFAAESVDASLDQVRIGRLEYRAGRTTAFELVRLATDLATSQQRYSQALVRAAKAAANLRALTAGAYPAAAR